MASGDHPEMDDSEPLDHEKQQKFQMLTGILHSIVTIRPLNVTFAAIMSVSRLNACPRMGNLDRAVKVFGRGRIGVSVSTQETQDSKVLNRNWKRTSASLYNVTDILRP